MAGGNNFYGDGLVAQLKKLSREELEQYVLMERLEPRTYPTVVIKNNEHMRVQNSVSECEHRTVSCKACY